MSISQFYQKLGISRPSYYEAKKRYIAEGNRVLNPPSRAPKTTLTVHGDQSKDVVLRIRRRLANSGWDHGPQSIWFEAVDTAEFGDKIPSVATIGRILAAAGVTKTNPRKRPRRAWMRFARSYPMELWQIDGLEYRFFDPDGTKAMIYQLLDDGTRFDVGTRCFARPENSEDAIEVLQAAFDEYGVPQELLSDNGVAFNQSRRGHIGNTETFLAEHGCQGITGRGSHPQAQGKNERSHQTLLNFLDAYVPRSLEQLSELLVRFREHYNHRRRPQGLKVGHAHLTPGQAWEAGEHRGSDGAAIDIAQLQANARTYRDRQLAARAAESPETQEATLLMEQHDDEVQPVQNLRLREQPEDVIWIPRTNPQIYYRGRVFKAPTYLVGEYQLVVTATAFTMFSTLDGEETIYFPLPVRVTSSKRLVPLWQVHGARIRNPKPAWVAKHLMHEKEQYLAQNEA